MAIWAYLSGINEPIAFIFGSVSKTQPDNISIKISSSYQQAFGSYDLDNGQPSAVFFLHNNKETIRDLTIEVSVISVHVRLASGRTQARVSAVNVGNWLTA